MNQILNSRIIAECKHGENVDSLKAQYFAMLKETIALGKHGKHIKVGNGYQINIVENGQVVEDISLLSDRHGWELSHTFLG